MARIDLKNVSVEFPIYSLGYRSFKKDFIRMATGGNVSKNTREHVIVRALEGISLTIHHGDRIGLIGHNGSGKSTLLRLLAEIYEPASGDLRIEGKVSSMLNIMQGMEAEFTGYDNIYIRGAILGISKAEILEKIDEIAEFTGLGDYLSMPVRTYSSGMMVRLAFAISTSISPDILLIDEVFGAGDSDFMQKAQQRMAALLHGSNIVVMATHANELIKEFCNKALLLEGGRIKFFGPVDEALAATNT